MSIVVITKSAIKPFPNAIRHRLQPDSSGGSPASAALEISNDALPGLFALSQSHERALVEAMRFRIPLNGSELDRYHSFICDALSSSKLRLNAMHPVGASCLPCG